MTALSGNNKIEKERGGKYDMAIVIEFLVVNRINMFRGGRYDNQEHPNILHGTVLATCVVILGTQPKTIRLINEMLR